LATSANDNVTTRWVAGSGSNSRPPADPDERRRRFERTSRLTVKLGGHRHIAKIPRARRYRVTNHGHRVTTAALAVHDRQFPDHYNTAA